MFKNNRNLFVVAVIMIVNALGYGVIIPILYSYSQKFGLSDFQNGLLFSTFSVCQFIATPFIGRLSDKYGRKPLLVLSITGTFISFVMMALAPNALFLFIARALDGITAGNFPVAAAVISDTTEPKDRAKGFGIIGAAFGFGFVFGPAISALTVGMGLAIPFIAAAAVTFVAVVLTAVVLRETNRHIGEVNNAPFFDLKRMLGAVFDERVGRLFAVSLLYMFAFSLYIYAVQPFAVKALGVDAAQMSIIFTVMGLVGLVAQVLVIPRVTRRLGEKKALVGALSGLVLAFFLLYLVNLYPVFLLILVLFSLANAFVNPLVQSLLSKETDARSQGSIMGLNTSYMSIGQIVGPVVGGLVATVSLPMPFLGGSLLSLICVYLLVDHWRRSRPKPTAFASGPSR